MRDLPRLLLLTAVLGFPARAPAGESVESFQGQVERVITRPGAWKKTGALVLREAGTTTPGRLVLEDPHLIRYIEQHHHVLFDDLTTVPLTGKNFVVRLRGVETGNRTFGGEDLPVALRVREIATDTGTPGDYEKVEALVAPVPVPDARHRFLEVPVCYARPEWGTFRLYYEVDSDYDPRRPTVMIPGTGQVETSWVGAADRYKKSFLQPDLNALVFQYRGTFASSIERVAVHRNLDWAEACQIFSISNVVEDMDRVRQDLLGPDGKMYLWGCSAVAVVAMAYLSRHSRHVPRAFLSGFFVDSESACRSEESFFQKFLSDRSLGPSYQRFLKERPELVPDGIFLTQRLLYSDQERAAALIRESAGGKRSLLDEEIQKQGSFDFFVRSAQLDWPQGVVFMYETNVPVHEDGRPDINLAVYTMGDIIRKKVPEEKRPPIVKIGGLAAIETEILLAAGTLDQIAPVEEMDAIRKSLPNARMAVFKAYHCLYEIASMRNDLSGIFYLEGLRSGSIETFVKSEKCREAFVELR